MNTTPGEKGFVISDLHIFSCVSLYERYLPVLEAAAAHYKVVVLNGDTFDFKRSRFSNHATTTHHAIEWLTAFLERHPNTTFFYLLGNHDCNDLFVAELTILAQRVKNVTIIADVLQIGACLFLHGDVCDLPIGVHDISQVRDRYRSAPRSLTSIVFAQIITHLRLNVAEYLRHRRQTLSERIMQYLRSVHPEKIGSVACIYFGHTHVPFKDFAYDGIKFNNTGSAIRGLLLNPMEFPLTLRTEPTP